MAFPVELMGNTRPRSLRCVIITADVVVPYGVVLQFAMAAGRWRRERSSSADPARWWVALDAQGVKGVENPSIEHSHPKQPPMPPSSRINYIDDKISLQPKIALDQRCGGRASVCKSSGLRVCADNKLQGRAGDALRRDVSVRESVGHGTRDTRLGDSILHAEYGAWWHNNLESTEYHGLTDCGLLRIDCRPE